MSTRQLRRLQKQREQEISKGLDEHEESDEPPTPQKPKPSLFANLVSLEDSTNNDESEETDEPHEEPFQPKSKVGSISTKPKKSKKKSKPTKKSGAKSIERIGEDDIERALKELGIKKSASSSSHDPRPLHANSEFERMCGIICVHQKHLKVSNEMRNLFGKTAVQKNNEVGRARGATLGQLQEQTQQVDLETALKGNHPPGKGLSEATLRRNFFIQGKEHWPKGTAGRMTVEIVNDQRSDRTVEFHFEHNQIYQDIQGAFHRNVYTGDPELLIELLIKNPDHISLLIQVSNIAKSQGDHSLSSDLLERALFYMGRAATSYFNTKLSQGKARLDFARPENREIWLAGYHYIKSLMMKGTYRTALEWSKLLFSLDPEGDPYCMRLMIHNLALRANESQWLLDLYGTEFYSRSVNSVAHDSISHTTPSLALAALRLRDHVNVRRLLTQSMEELPWLYTRLFSTLNLETPPSVWGNEPRSDSEAIHTDIYTSQTRDLWNTPEATSLLMEIGHTIPRVDISTKETSPHLVTLDLARFIYLENRREIMILVPRDLLHRSNNSDSDPLPPDVNILSYEGQRVITDETRSIHVPHDLFQPMSALLRILRSLPDFGQNALEQVIANSIAGGEHQGENEHQRQFSVVSFARGLLIQQRISRDHDEDETDEQVEAEQEISDLTAPEREAVMESRDITDGNVADLVPILAELSSRVMRMTTSESEDHEETDS